MLKGLNDKLTVRNDLKTDLATHRNHLNDSETKRLNLQDELRRFCELMDQTAQQNAQERNELNS